MPFNLGHPVCINKITVGVRVLRLDKTVRDDDFREAKQNCIYDVPFVVIGQVVGLEPTFQLERTRTGDALPSQMTCKFHPGQVAPPEPALSQESADASIIASFMVTDS